MNGFVSLSAITIATAAKATPAKASTAERKVFKFGSLNARNMIFVGLLLQTSQFVKEFRLQRIVFISFLLLEPKIELLGTYKGQFLIEWRTKACL